MSRRITIGALLLAMALTGCGTQSSYRTTQAAHAFAGMNCGMNGGTYVNGRCVRDRVLLVCDTDANCAAIYGRGY